ncbi:hypothetical protein BD413DRAFT_493744 [Trametes elegans]|nr:hypothetical protein BD413DRAFT_493744 [Trametes elegans]
MAKRRGALDEVGAARLTPAQLPPEHSTSTIFHRAFALNGTPPDTSLVSSDAIYFHVHRQQLLACSTNAFGGRLTQHTPALSLPESSAALNVVLHTIYGMSCVHTGPPLEDTEAAVGALVKYGLPVAHLAAPGMPLYQLMLSYAPYRPIEAYALAGHFRLDALAAAVSSHLLAFDVSTLSDALAVKMGPVYFRRLYDLHRARLAALRTIVLRPPARHALTPGCNEEVQQEVSRAWAFASAEIVWNARPNISTYALHSAFAQAARAITCPDCKEMVNTRIQEVMNEWSAVKRTI